MILESPVPSGPVCVPSTRPGNSRAEGKRHRRVSGTGTRAVRVQVWPPESEQLEDELLDEAPRLTVVCPGRAPAAGTQSSSTRRTRERTDRGARVSRYLNMLQTPAGIRSCAVARLERCYSSSCSS